MPLILAIDPDKRQSSQLSTLVKTQLQAELVHRTTAADALDALKGRVPDLVLTSSLISPREDAALAAHLRDLGAAAAHVQTITIPLLGSVAPQRAKGMLSALRREKPQTAMTDGCAPDVFAEQIRQYLRTADEQKAAAAAPFAAALAEAPVAETAAEPAAVAEAIAIEAAPAPEPEAVAVAGEPDRLPLSQLLRLVSDSTAAPPTPTAALESAPLADEPAQLEEHAAEPAPFEAQAAEPLAAAPFVEVQESAGAPEWNDDPPIASADIVAALAPVSEPGDLDLDPVAAQALEELSRQLPPPSLADGIPAEAPVPVVEMQTFETLDAIASQLAAAPLPKHDSLDDLASLFAATPTLPHAGPATSGFDTPPPGPGRRHEFESLFVKPSAEFAAPIEVPGIDPSLFASPAAQPPSEEPLVPVRAEPTLTETVSAKPVLAEPVLAAPRLVEPVVEHVLAETALPEFELLEPAAAEWEQEAAVDRSWAPAAPEPIGAEIALDVDAFDAAVAAPAAEPAAPADTSFSFTFVDGFGDTWSDFDVPSVSAVAADLGLPPSGPMETEPVAAAANTTGCLAASAAAPATAPAPEPAAAPMLDDEALSLIGDAAHKASIDAFVIEEFERGVRHVERKAKKAHAGATQVTPAATPAVKKKAPAQDEWGFFDPEQCGFAALEDEDPADRRKARDGTRVRVISY